MFTNQEYIKEINTLAKWFNDTDPHGEGVAFEYGEDCDRGDALFRKLNNHRYTNYTACSRFVVAHSLNANVMFEEYGDTVTSGSSLSRLDRRRALCAMQADVYSEALRILQVRADVDYIKSRHQ